MLDIQKQSIQNHADIQSQIDTIYKTTEFLQEGMTIINNKVTNQDSLIQNYKDEMHKVSKLLIKLIDVLRDKEILESNTISFPGPGHKLSD